MGGRRDVKTIEDIPGVGIAIAGRLHAAGYGDIMTIAIASPRELSQKCEIGEKKAMDIIEGAKFCADIGGFESGEDILDMRRKAQFLTTGFEALDELMGGGIRNRSITQLFGKREELNTELCMRLAVNATLPIELGGLDSDIIIINSRNGMFDPDRVVSIAENIGINPENVLKRIHASTTFDTNHQMMLVEKAAELAGEKKIGLLIVDSMAAHFKEEYKGREMLGKRQSLLFQHLRDLLNFATLNNAVVVVTNMAVDAPYIGAKPWGGNIIKSTVTFSLYVRKGAKGIAIVRLTDSPNLPEGEAVIPIE